MDAQQFRTLHGTTLTGQDGAKIGKISDVYEPAHAGGSWFATVHTGLFGTGSSFVPLDGATQTGETLAVPYTKDFVKGAPHISDDAEISQAEEQEIYSYYGIGGGTSTTTATAPPTTTTAATAPVTTAPAATGTATADVGSYGARDTSGANTDDAMTRSEERLQVGTQSVEAGRARLRKYIVTENVTQTVPVSHEEVRIEREPITAGNADAAYSGKDLSEEEVEVTLHAERPVVAKETVPVERVRLATDTVQEQQTVNETVRKEQIDTEGVTSTTGTTTTDQDVPRP